MSTKIAPSSPVSTTSKASTDELVPPAHNVTSESAVTPKLTTYHTVEASNTTKENKSESLSRKIAPSSPVSKTSKASTDELVPSATAKSKISTKEDETKATTPLKSSTRKSEKILITTSKTSTNKGEIVAVYLQNFLF